MPRPGLSSQPGSSGPWNRSATPGRATAGLVWPEDLHFFLTEPDERLVWEAPNVLRRPLRLWTEGREERYAYLPKVRLRPPGHQFQSPRTRMVAGTSRMRMIVASTNTATARPRPIALVMMTLLKAKAPVTTIIMAAADVMIPAVEHKNLSAAFAVGMAVFGGSFL